MTDNPHPRCSQCGAETHSVLYRDRDGSETLFVYCWSPARLALQGPGRTEPNRTEQNRRDAT